MPWLGVKGTACGTAGRACPRFRKSRYKPYERAFCHESGLASKTKNYVPLSKLPSRSCLSTVVLMGRTLSICTNPETKR